MEKLASLRHLFVTIFLGGFSGCVVIPAITDVTMSALCPGQDECSLAIYLSGIQQAIVGVGTVVMTPIIGNLSDRYGRKALLTIPMALSIIPLAILAYSRSKTSFYTYYGIRAVTAMVGEGSVNCLALAYVADNISEGERTSAFGILSGVVSAAFVFGTLAARFLSTASTFQVATLGSMIATVYMRIFLKESLPNGDSSQPFLKKEPGFLKDTVPNGDSSQPFLKKELAGIISPLDDNSDTSSSSSSSEKIQGGGFKKIPAVGDLISLLKCRAAFSQAAVIVFFNSLADGGLQASLLYFWKAQFHFNKDQFADIMLIIGVTGTISQLLFMPLLAPRVSEEKLLCIGLLTGSAHIFLNSIAWSFWVPYAAAALAAAAVIATPCVRSIVSKQVGPNEQGKAQGCISGISSSAQIISPLIFSPLTALFLSEGAPFYFPGFSIMCIAFASMIAFIQSTMIRAGPPISSQLANNCNCIEP